MFNELKKYSSNESRLKSGRGEIHVRPVEECDGEITFIGGIGWGDVHGEFSDDDVWTEIIEQVFKSIRK